MRARFISKKAVSPVAFRVSFSFRFRCLCDRCKSTERARRFRINTRITMHRASGARLGQRSAPYKRGCHTVYRAHCYE